MKSEVTSVRRVRSTSSRDRWATLFSLHSAPATRLAYLLTGDMATAEDLVQEAFVRLISRFNDRKEPDVVRQYLSRTILNLARSRYRRQKIERRYAQSERNAAVIEMPDPRGLGPVWEALMRLPVRQRAAVYLRYYEDQSEQHVAEAMGCSVSAVKSLLLRSRRTLARELEDEHGQD